MIEFNIYRAQVRSHAEMERFISTYWTADNILGRGSFGVIPLNAESIVTEFELTQRAFCKSIKLLVHCISITFSKDMPEEYVLDMINMVRAELSQNYQFIDLMVKDDAGNLEVGFIINSVSYKTGLNFHDNNYTYTVLIKRLEQMAGEFCKVRFGGSVFFKSVGSNMNCYMK